MVLVGRGDRQLLHPYQDEGVVRQNSSVAFSEVGTGQK